MVIRAHTHDGQPIDVSFPAWVGWVTSILSVVIAATIVSTAAKLVDMEQRVTAIESSRFTAEDARAYVTIREFDARVQSITTQLSRIEGKIDRLQENGR